MQNPFLKTIRLYGLDKKIENSKEYPNMWIFSVSEKQNK